jgi:hypothetical protein
LGSIASFLFGGSRIIMAKKIKVKCYGTVAVDKQAKSPWEDVYLEWTEKPGRKKRNIGLTVISKSNLEMDLKINKELVAKFPECDIQKDIDYELKALKELEKNQVYIHAIASDYPDRDDYKDLLEVFTSKEYLDRAEIDRLIGIVADRYGYPHVVTKWKRPSFFVHSV